MPKVAPNHAYQILKKKKKRFHRAVFDKPLKLQLSVFLAGHTVAMVTYYVMERITMCSPIVGQFFDTMIVASSDKEWP